MSGSVGFYDVVYFGDSPTSAERKMEAQEELELDKRLTVADASDEIHGSRLAVSSAEMDESDWLRALDEHPEWECSSLLSALSAVVRDMGLS